MCVCVILFMSKNNSNNNSKKNLPWFDVVGWSGNRTLVPRPAQAFFLRTSCLCGEYGNSKRDMKSFLSSISRLRKKASQLSDLTFLYYSGTIRKQLPAM